MRQLGKATFEQLKADQANIARTLIGRVSQDPTGSAVQQQIARHYQNIRSFWSESVCASKNRAEAYKGLANLYVDDPQFTTQNGQANPAFAAFLTQAMIYFADTQIRK